MEDFMAIQNLLEEQLRIILKGADCLIDKQELIEKLELSIQNQKPLTIKLGLDPSAPDIHLGHAVVLRKIRQMQDLGHHAAIVIGDFTGRIGDPTGKKKGRPALSNEQVLENATTYCNQIFKILDQKKTSVSFNSTWLSKLNFEAVLHLASSATVARMLERDDFQTRYQNQIPIGIHEFFYPLMQAYDSVELQADIELGGTDQRFNILMGRNLQKAFHQSPQCALLMPILEGTDGADKMSKSLGNYIGIQEPAEIMFKKIMEIPDSLIIKYYELATDLHPDQIEAFRIRLEEGENPKDIKYHLAQTITALYHTEKELQDAIKYYNTAFVKKEIPNEIPHLLLEEEQDTLEHVISLLVKNHYLKSKNEFLRILAQGGISLDGERLTSEDRTLVIFGNQVLKIGKKRFFRLIK